MKKSIKILVGFLAFIAVFVGTYFYAKYFGTIGFKVNEYYYIRRYLNNQK